MRHFLEMKFRGNDIIERIYADSMPAPFLLLITDDCIEKGFDYNEGGARYNTSYIQVSTSFGLMPSPLVAFP